MRMDRDQKLTAAEIVNTYGEKEIADILYHMRRRATVPGDCPVDCSFPATFDHLDLAVPSKGLWGRRDTDAFIRRRERSRLYGSR